MIKLATAKEIQEIDRRAEKKYGIPSLLSMETAGINAADLLVERFWKNRTPAGPFVFLAGKGNNGGDAFVMARRFFLTGKKNCAIILAQGAPADDADPGVNLAVCRSLDIPVCSLPEDPDLSWRLLEAAEVVFDGLAGTGLRGALREPLAGLVGRLNSLDVMRVAIDVPSGLGDEFQAGQPILNAQVTLTMGLPKRALFLPAARAACGRIITVPLCYPSALIEDSALRGELLDHDDLQSLLPRLPASAHKNTRGHLAVFAGAVGTTGAAILAATAAARARTGLVTIFTDPEAYPLLASHVVSVMARPVTAASLDKKNLEARFRALLLGPGFGLTDSKKALMKSLLTVQLPLLIDADGLTLLAGLDPRDVRGREQSLILTPHPGECARLLDLS
ncbi:MAG TPA: NAD(P)H-hydrate epimerase, partial [Spirochaetia bacterium]|nr:NAD(P)H-hydrate epimerase [Spirochaetia bacterium]